MLFDRKDVRIETFDSRPGYIRLVHEPTGYYVEHDDASKSQHQLKELAMVDLERKVAVELILKRAQG